MLLIENPRFSTYKRLIADRLDSIRSSPSAEKLNGGRAYKLFSKVVDYADFFHGIKSIVIDKNEALAKIQMPDSHVGGDESSVTKHCDTASIDAFIQVSGLLINSRKACPPGQVFVASGLENITMSRHCDFDVHKDWSVYAIFTLIDDVHATGDVFVLTKLGEVAMTAIGAKFHRLEISKLERTLDSANGSRASSKEAPRPSLPTPIPSFQNSRPTVVQKPTSLAPDSDSGFSSASSVAEEDPDDREAPLKTMISTYTGAPADFIASNTCIGDLGIDSLAAVELSDEISERSGKLVSTHLAPPASRMPATSTSSLDQSAGITEPSQSFLAAESSLQHYAMSCRFIEYLAKVVARQDELLIAYLVEGFRKLDVNLKTIEIGEKMPPFTYQSKHNKVVQRYYGILERHSIIKKKDSAYVRPSGPCMFAPFAQLLQQLIVDFPQDSCEAELMALTLRGIASRISLSLRLPVGRLCDLAGPGFPCPLVELAVRQRQHRTFDSRRRRLLSHLQRL